MSIPENLKYTIDHEWIRLDNDVAFVGVTDYAVEALGDVVFVELPEPGTSVTAGDSCGEIESTKSVSDLVSPATGDVLESNTAVSEKPDILNSDPYGDGWLIKIRITGDLAVLDHLQYAELIAKTP